MGADAQLPLALPSAAGLTREHFVASGSNAAALALVERWPAWPSPLVVLAGPTGAGKTHLASIWRSASNAMPLDPRRLGPTGEAPARAVLLEDCDAGPLDETGLFHLVNAVRAAGGTMLMTARTAPGAWGVRLPDLLSRLRAATLVEIAEPDDALLSAVIAKLFADRQVEVEPHVVSYLVRRIERSLATAAAVVDRLDRESLARGMRISRALAAEIITAFDEGQRELPL